MVMSRPVAWPLATAVRRTAIVPPRSYVGVVVDRGHDGVVQDVDVEVDPEPGGAADPLQGEGGAGGRPGASLANRRQVHGVDGRGEGPASFGGGVVGVAEPEHHHRPRRGGAAPSASRSVTAAGAASGDEGELHRGGLARGSASGW